jgi:hypothetical protein
MKALTLLRVGAFALGRKKGPVPCADTGGLRFYFNRRSA